jgi:hypothetical protein
MESSSGSFLVSEREVLLGSARQLSFTLSAVEKVLYQAYIMYTGA